MVQVEEHGDARLLVGESRWIDVQIGPNRFFRIQLEVGPGSRAQWIQLRFGWGEGDAWLPDSMTGFAFLATHAPALRDALDALLEGMVLGE